MSNGYSLTPAARYLRTVISSSWRRATTALTVVSAAIGLLLTVGPAHASAPRPRLARPVEALLIGDSVMNGMAQGYGAPGRALLAERHSFILDSAGCRRLITTSCRIPPSPAPTDALTVLRARAGQFDTALVIAAGYDDPTFGADGIGAAVDTMVAEARRQGVTTVVWLTYREAGTAGNVNRFRAHNAVLRQKQSADPGLVLADWNRVSQGLGKGSFSADGIHLGAAATTAMAVLIADTLDHLPPRLIDPGRCASALWSGSVPAPSATAPGPGSAAASGGVHVLTRPVRVADTRELPGKLGAGRMLAIPVAGANGVAPDASAALVTITAAEPCAPVYVVAFPCGAPVPATSVLNAGVATTVANAALVLLGGGALCIVASQPTDVLVDLTGWIGSAGALATPIAPVRIMDTRGTGERLRAGTQRAIDIAAVAGTAADIDAVTVNLTAVQPATDGFLSLLPGPCDAGAPAPVPATSSINVAAGHDAAASTTVATGAGQICIYSSVDTDAVVDLQAVHATTAGAPADPSVAPINPVRALDTRPTQRLRAGTIVSLAIDSVGAPPGVTGAVINVTAVGPAASGYVVAYGCGADIPGVSTVNSAAGVTVANHAIVQLGAARSICLTSSIDTDVVVDVEAWLLQ